MLNVQLTLFKPCPCHVFAYNCANTRMTALKNLTFPKYEFGKGHYANPFEYGQSFTGKSFPKKNWNPIPTQPQDTCI